MHERSRAFCMSQLAHDSAGMVRAARLGRLDLDP